MRHKREGGAFAGTTGDWLSVPISLYWPLLNRVASRTADKRPAPKVKKEFVYTGKYAQRLRRAA